MGKVTLFGARHDVDPAGSTDRGDESIITGQVRSGSLPRVTAQHSTDSS